MLITLSALSEKIDPIDPPPEFKLKDLIAQSEDTGNHQHFAEPMKRKNKVKKPKPHASSVASEGDSDCNVNGHGDMSRFD